MCMARKIRVNVTVDSELLKQAKKKLGLFSTLFNAYLTDFVKSMDEEIGKGHKELLEKFRELEKRIEKLEKD